MQVLVSPLLIAGWCGMVSQALQLLPVGSVDGGRMVQVRTFVCTKHVCVFIGRNVAGKNVNAARTENITCDVRAPVLTQFS